MTLTQTPLDDPFTEPAKGGNRTTKQGEIMKRGTHVNAVVETGQEPVIAHYLDQDGDKEVLQLADGSIGRYARRDPSDYDERGGGMTWYPIGD